MSRRSHHDDRNDAAGVEQGLDLELDRVLDGFVSLDRDLELGTDLGAARAGGDAQGRPVLVCEVRGRADDVLLVLDVLAFARTRAELIARHLSGPAADRATALEASLSGAVRVVVLVARARRRFVERLRVLGAPELEVFERQSLKGDTGRTRILSPVPFGDGADARGRFVPGEPFGTLDARLAALAEIAARRVERIDDRVRASTAPGSVVWQLAGRELCRLEAIAGRLRCRVVDGPTLDLSSDADVDEFVEAVLGAFVGAGHGARGAASVFDRVEADLRPPEPIELLTPEELEAFRD